MICVVGQKYAVLTSVIQTNSRGFVVSNVKDQRVYLRYHDDYF